MAVQPKPATQPIWAEAGDVVKPNDPKISLGWIVEKPPHEMFNWIHNNLASFAAHVNESGLPEWDVLTSYDVDSLAKGSDGTVYASLTNGNLGNDPITTPSSDWRVAFGPANLSRVVATNDQFTNNDLPTLDILITESTTGNYSINGTAYTLAELTVIRDALKVSLMAVYEV